VPLISTLFRYGEFSVNDLWMTRQALTAYSVGLLGLILVKVLAPGFYARQNIRTPVKIAVFTLVATQLMNLALIGPLKHAGLALAIGLGACLNAGLLYYKLRTHRIYQPQPGWRAFGYKLALALLVMAAVLWGAMGSEAWWLGAAWHYRVTGLVGIVLLGAGTYFASLWLLGFRIKDFARRAAE
jgi:putative peptidoglycan lipid II flippase